MKLNTQQGLAILILPDNYLYCLQRLHDASFVELLEHDIIREYNGGHKLTAKGAAIRHQIVSGDLSIFEIEVV